MNYNLSKHQTKQTRDQWRECPRTGINDLPPCRGIGGSKPMISGQNARGQESMTYLLSRHQRKQILDQWTECPRTGINDLRPVKASEEANP